MVESRPDLRPAFPGPRRRRRRRDPLVFSQDLPSLDPLQNYQPSLVTRVYSDDRQVIGQFFIERRFLKPIQEMPKSLTQAVIATEDTRFLNTRPGHRGHSSGDLDELAPRRQEGRSASTITQQLARSLFLSRRSGPSPTIAKCASSSWRTRWSWS